MRDYLPAPEDRLYGDADLAQFYDLDNGWGADLDYCFCLAADATSVLDLGCGTGRLAASLATAPQVTGGRVTGVDPAAAMIDIARRRPGGDQVNWIIADARQLRLTERFDLVLLTGHAFQVFLTDADRLATLQTIAAHLTPDGRFIFDTRNPVMEEWRGWIPALSLRELDHPTLGLVKAWNDVSHDAATGIVTYETHYQAVTGNRAYSATSQIAFPDRETVTRLMDEAGLQVECWLGDWAGNPYRSDMPEMIPIGRRHQK
jgi:SAM-dependent methyltransferase